MTHPNERPAPLVARGTGLTDTSGGKSEHTDDTAESAKTELAAAAVEYAGAGWPVFPLDGKEPIRGSHGFKDGTLDPDTIRRWWERFPKANIGTGIPPTLAVVDVDAKAGGMDTLRRLEDTDGVPDTLTVLTGGGGLHLYFLHPTGDLRQTAGALGEEIDTRIPGKGYTVLPPSVHPSGRLYEWFDPETDPAPMPRWMVDALRPTPPPGRAARRAARAWGTGNLDGRLRGVLSTVSSDGPNWNDRLHWAACRAGEMVTEGADPVELERLLLEAAAPWNDRERRAAEATIRSGMNRTGGAA